MRLCTARIGGGAARRNLEYTAGALAQDSKNIHAWTQRAWCVRTFGLWAEEMEYTAAMIEDDVRNNSAWNERFFCFSNAPQHGGGGGVAARADAEIAFAEGRIDIAPDNESAWNYLRGILRHAAVGWTHGGHGERIARLYCGNLGGDGDGDSGGGGGGGEGGGGSGGGGGGGGAASGAARKVANGDERPCRHAMNMLAEVRLAAAAGWAGVGGGGSWEGEGNLGTAAAAAAKVSEAGAAAEAAAEAAGLFARLAAVDPVRVGIGGGPTSSSHPPLKLVPNYLKSSGIL